MNSNHWVERKKEERNEETKKEDGRKEGKLTRK